MDAEASSKDDITSVCKLFMRFASRLHAHTLCNISDCGRLCCFMPLAEAQVTMAAVKPQIESMVRKSPSAKLRDTALNPSGAAHEVLALMADGRLHSGQELASRLRVTRAAIWKQVRQLRGQGLPVAAVAGRGYQLPWPLELLDTARIVRALPSARRQALASLDVLWRTASTSDVLRAPSLEITRQPRVVLAESQSAGRGRRGRAWLSPPGLNICLSLATRFDCGAAALAGLSLAVGVMLLRALDDVGCNRAGLKWPNDILADNAKLAGVLVEIDGEYSGPYRVVIGVGLNLRMPEALCRQADQPVTDLARLMAGEPPSRNTLAAAMISRLIEGLEQFRQNGFAAFADDYFRYDLLRGKPLKITSQQAAWFGQGAGVDARGALRVRTESGELVSVDSSDVSVRRT